MTVKPILAIDFDNTIKSTNNFKDMSTPPADFAVEAITELYLMQCELILWTSREGPALEEAKEYLRKHNILHCFVAFNEPSPSLKFKQGRKIFANYYVDDLNFGGFSGFKELLETVKKDIEEYTLFCE